MPEDSKPRTTGTDSGPASDRREHRKEVMISSTARDLPEHRKEVLDACLRQGMFPHMMEHLPASDAEAISANRSSSWTRRTFTSASSPTATAMCRNDHDDFRHRDGVRPRRRAQDPAPDLRDGQGASDHIEDVERARALQTQ